MNKRQFLQGALGVAGSALLPAGVHAMTPAPSTSNPDWTLGWRSARPGPLPRTQMSVEGGLPRELHGSLYRNGPALTQRNGVNYRHWFDGDGMIQHFELGADAAYHTGRYVQTHKYQREQAAGRFLYSAAGTELADSEPAGNNDTANVANISVLPWNGELLALWEGGSAYRLDLKTLETLGRKDWRDDLKHMPFSAHPLLEADGTMWNFGSAPYSGRNGKLIIYKATPQKGMVAVQAVDLPMAGYQHSFAMTERYLVFYFGPHLFERGGKTFVDSFHWAADRSSKVLIVDKNDLTAQRWFEAPTGFVFHCAHAYEQGSQIVAQMCTYATADIMQVAMVDLMHSTGTATYPDYPRAVFSELRLDLNSGQVRSTSTDVLMEFPGIDSRLADAPATVYGVGHSDPASAAWSDSVIGIDPESGKVDRYAFPEHHIVEEPLFVAGARAGHDWLVGTFLDFGREQTGIYVLRANDIAAGPVTMARMNRTVPLGFHGCFVAA